MLGSAYLLGYPCEKLIEMYQNESPQLKSLNDGLIRTGITKDNWRQFLGKKKYTFTFIPSRNKLTIETRYTAAYTTFFDQELANTQNDWKELVNEYLFTPPQPLINGFIGGRKPSPLPNHPNQKLTTVQSATHSSTSPTPTNSPTPKSQPKP